MGKIIVLVAVVLVAGVLTARMAEHVPLPSRSALATAPAAAAPPASAQATRSVTLMRGEGGHFWTEVRIDGRRLELIVDTGASQIALRASDAARLGLHPVARDFNVRVATANGVTRAALVQLRRVEIGHITLRDLPALVHADEALGVNLLGMSFLSRLRWVHERGRLILEQ
jgi:aspartyl protease family protein